MKCHKRVKKPPHEDSYLTIFNRQYAPRSRRKQAWPDQLSLDAKKRILACNADRDPFQEASVAKEETCKKDGGAELRGVPSTCAASTASQPNTHTKSSVDPTSRPLSGPLVDCAEVPTTPGARVRVTLGSSELGTTQSCPAAVQDELTLEDCWPSNELNLQWLKLGGEKMQAFQTALRRRLSIPAEACHWPLPACTKCATTPLYARGVAKLSTRSVANECTGGEQSRIVGQNEGAVVLRDLNTRNGDSAGGGGPEAACCCTCAGDCALVISEDPLLRLSLLAMSLGISEVHTVVMKHANWEGAATFARCFGRPDNLKVFRSLEALEEEVFDPRIAQMLTGEATPPHTCRGAASCDCQLKGDAVTGSAPGLNGRHYCQEANTRSAEADESAVALQAHLHRYRIVLIDDQYCGPIVSAFGLPVLLEFVRTHTCPACCQVMPRRWQTLATPASCPPPTRRRHYVKLVDGEKLNEPLQGQLATSGRAMSGASIRLEDVALSGRFCVLERFELTSLVRCAYKDPEGIEACGLCTEVAGGIANVSNEGSSTKKGLDCRLSKQQALKASCLRCARDRQLKWSAERQTVVNGNVVCGVEVAGPCAGLIVRSHILVDEGIALFPTAPLMIFLPEEVQLSTGHVVMLRPGSATRGTDELQKARPIVPPWRNLKAQQPSRCWQWTAIRDGIRHSELGIEVTLRDLHQTTREHDAADVP